MEEALGEIMPMRAFAGLSLMKVIPDETTIVNFRHSPGDQEREGGAGSGDAPDEEGRPVTNRGEEKLGSDLLFHTLEYSTIGDEGLDF